MTRTQTQAAQRSHSYHVTSMWLPRGVHVAAIQQKWDKWAAQKTNRLVSLFLKHWLSLDFQRNFHVQFFPKVSHFMQIFSWMFLFKFTIVALSIAARGKELLNLILLLNQNGKLTKLKNLFCKQIFFSFCSYLLEIFLMPIFLSKKVHLAVKIAEFSFFFAFGCTRTFSQISNCWAFESFFLSFFQALKLYELLNFSSFYASISFMHPKA